MNLSATIFLAFAMSTDAFAASVSKGATLYKPTFKEALRTGLIFGGIETITPLIGWLIGTSASDYVMAWNHWIAFGVLSILGIRMIIEGIRADEENTDEEPLKQHSFKLLVITAFATSLDAMAIGVSVALLEANILHISLAIGLATLIMSTLGILLGRVIGPFLGKRAEMLGGVVLILIGCGILAEHFNLFA